jgi:hypothetical protein
VLYVTEADGKTAIAAHAESDAANAAETLAIAIMEAGPCSEASRDYEQWRRENKDTTKFSNWFEWENAALGDLRQEPKKISGEMFERIIRRRMSGSRFPKYHEVFEDPHHCKAAGSSLTARGREHT